jgi:hypothetical protein
VGVFKVERDHAAAPVRMAGKRKQSKLTLVAQRGGNMAAA